MGWLSIRKSLKPGDKIIFPEGSLLRECTVTRTGEKIIAIANGVEYEVTPKCLKVATIQPASL